MGQAEIMKILGKLGKNEWISTIELQKKLDCSKSTVISSLLRMKKYGEVVSRKMPCNGYNSQLEHKLTEVSDE